MKKESNNSYHKLPILDGLELLNANHHTEDFPFHTHNTFNITLVLDQIFSTKLSDRLLHASTGAIVITNPDEVHATICDNKLGSSFFTFYVSPEVLKELNEKRPVTFYDKIINDHFLFQELYALSREYYSSKNEIEKKLLLALRRLVRTHSTDTIIAENKRRLFHTFLEESDLEKFSLENTASKFGLDKFKFLRLFKQETGLTPNNYIILKRIEKCKELLQTQDDLLDIAIQTGFYDATHLCKYFKKITGITPLAYRHA
jgi:AraC-like DNA-binding protein